MQKGGSQLTSGNIAPSISGPKKDKDVLVVSGLIVGLAAVIGAIWYYSVITSHPSRRPHFPW
jgi:peptidoglycan-associated lipoprotein